MLSEIFSESFPFFELNRTILFYIFCGLALLFIFVRSIFHKDWTVLWESFRNGSSAKMHHQQGNLRISLAATILLLIASVIYSVLIFEYARATGWELVLANFNFISLLASVFTFLVVRLVVYMLLTYLIPKHKEAMLYVKTIALFGIYAAFALVPLALLVSFNDSVSTRLISGGFLLIMAVFVGGRVYRGFSIARSHFARRKDYFFMYLCGLEIRPFALIFRGFWDVFR